MNEEKSITFEESVTQNFTAVKESLEAFQNVVNEIVEKSGNNFRVIEGNFRELSEAHNRLQNQLEKLEERITKLEERKTTRTRKK